MTDRSRPTVEALIAQLGDPLDSDPYETRRRSARVLGALLTERDDQREVKNMWIERAAHFAKERDAARAQIAEALRRLREHEDTYGGWPQLGADLHAILFRDVQEATEPSGSAVTIAENEMARQDRERFLAKRIDTTDHESGAAILGALLDSLLEPETEPLWQDPEPSIRGGWRHSYRPDCDTDPDCHLVPRSRAVYDAETKDEKP